MGIKVKKIEIAHIISDFTYTSILNSYNFACAKTEKNNNNMQKMVGKIN
jgi:hypothetical protein